MSEARDVTQIVRYLTTTLNNAMSSVGMERPLRTDANGANDAYKVTTEFAYILNEIVQGPRCMQQKYITDCNEVINQVLSYKPAKEG